MGLIQMMKLRIQLFQSLTVQAGDGPLLDIGSPTARSLFAYLVLHRAQMIDRRRLAFLFWPRSSEQAARRNLRQYLHRLRRGLEPVDPAGQMLFAEGNQVGLQLPEDFYLDVALFETAVSSSQENLAEAVTIYRGDLLEDIYDDWVTPERERLARLYREALLRLIDQKEAAGHFAEAITYAERYQMAEPLLENAYVRLMRLHYAAGDRGRVQQQYQQLTAVLRDELGAEPLPETAAMAEAMFAGEYSYPAAAVGRPFAVSQQLTPVAIAERVPARPPSTSPFVGRVAELAQLEEAWGAALEAQGRFVFIQGESGVGKTRPG